MTLYQRKWPWAHEIMLTVGEPKLMIGNCAALIFIELILNASCTCLWVHVWNFRQFVSKKLWSNLEKWRECEWIRRPVLEKGLTWLDWLRTMSETSVSSYGLSFSGIPNPRLYRVRASKTSSVARSDIVDAMFCSISLQMTVIRNFVRNISGENLLNLIDDFTASRLNDTRLQEFIGKV